LVTAGRRHALVTERNPERWLAQVERDGHGLIESEPLSTAEQADEMLLMGLRLAEGIDLARLSAIGGTRPNNHAIAELADLGLVESMSNNRLRATARGRFVLNTLVLKLSSSLVRA
jgi:oxygen-independent coproporphyrinogen-3 oxidase